MAEGKTEGKIGVYLMPGLAAGPEIFEHLKLPREHFDVHHLHWFVPETSMSLAEYAREMCRNIQHPNPVLIGVSFGGMLVQEMAAFTRPRRVIIISSIKTKKEMPRRLLLARYTKLHRLLPTRLLDNVEVLARYAFGGPVKKRLKLYERYLAVRDPRYLDWAIDQIVHWDREEPVSGLIHIHGDQDAIFPYMHLGPCTTVPGGTHTMIIHRARWFNEHLPAIILQDASSI